MFRVEKITDDDDTIANDADINDDDDNENNNKSKLNHELLIKDVKQKIGKKYSNQEDQQWKVKRYEIRDTIDDIGIIKTKKQLNANELLTSDSINNDNKEDVKKIEKFNEKLLKKFDKKKNIHQPLHKHIADSILRKLNFNELNESISKYDEIVKQTRHAEQLIFPAADDRLLKMETKPEKKLLAQNNEIIESSSSTNKPLLEKEIIETLNQENPDSTSVHQSMGLSDDEMRLLRTLNLEEARKLHKEMQRSRVLISYQEAKFRRMRKIKSKKYHRIQRKNRLKNSVEEFDALVANNDSKAQEKLDELDRLRALERASLKHMNTGKWAKHQRIRAKYNDQSRNELNEQLKINQEMMKKRAHSILNEIDDNVNDDDIDEDDTYESDVKNKNNEKFEEPKISIEELTKQPFDYCPWSSKIIQKPKNSKTQIQSNDDTDKNDDSSKKSMDSMHQIDKILTSTSSDVKNLELEIDSNSKLEQQNESENNDKINLFEHNEKLLNIFGDDNEIVEQFLKEQQEQKQAKINAKMDEKQSKYLPGWGSNKWSGYGINETKKFQNAQRKRLETNERKRNEEITRAIFIDENKQNNNEIIQKYQTYLTQKQSLQLQRPLGQLWNPEIISKTLREPRIVIRTGQIIDPMQPESLQTTGESDKQKHVSKKLMNKKVTKQQAQRKPLSM